MTSRIEERQNVYVPMFHNAFETGVFEAVSDELNAIAEFTTQLSEDDDNGPAFQFLSAMVSDLATMLDVYINFEQIYKTSGDSSQSG